MHIGKDTIKDSKMVGENSYSRTGEGIQKIDQFYRIQSSNYRNCTAIASLERLQSGLALTIHDRESGITMEKNTTYSDFDEETKGLLFVLPREICLLGEKSRARDISEGTPALFRSGQFPRTRCSRREGGLSGCHSEVAVPLRTVCNNTKNLRGRCQDPALMDMELRLKFAKKRYLILELSSSVIS